MNLWEKIQHWKKYTIQITLILLLPLFLFLDCPPIGFTGSVLEMVMSKTAWPASWEICMQVKKQQLEMAWNRLVAIRKGVHQGCILSPCLFNFYAEYIMRNTGLEGAQDGIKIACQEKYQ